MLTAGIIAETPSPVFANVCRDLASSAAAREESVLDNTEQAAPAQTGAHRCWSGLVRRKGRIRESLLQGTHFSKFPGRSLRCFEPPCKRSSRRYLSYSSTLPSRFLGCWGGWSVSARLCLARRALAGWLVNTTRQCCTARVFNPGDPSDSSDPQRPRRPRRPRTISHHIFQEKQF